MKIFTDKYGKTMKSIKISLNDLTTDDLKSCLIELSLFENLQSLDLSIDNYDIKHNAIDEYLRQMTRNLNKLKNFSLKICNQYSLISGDFFTLLPQLKQIESLELELEIDGQSIVSIKSMIECPKLKKLVIDYAKLTKSFFKDIQSSIPRMEFLTIKTFQRISDKFFTYLSSIKYLQKVSYCYGIENIQHYYYYNQSIKNCEHNGIKVKSNCWKVVPTLE